MLVYLDSSRETSGVLRRAIGTAAQQVRGPVAVLGAIAETLVAEDGTPTGPATPEDRDRWVAPSAPDPGPGQHHRRPPHAAQIQRGALRVDLADVDAAEVARRVAAEHDLSVTTAGPEGAVTVTVEDHRAVRADPVRLAQALRTLLSNCPPPRRATGRGTRPARRGAPRPRGRRGRRHGPGVDADLVERVFA